jgi:regulator of sirC expression with transglutaminase-like and TPR domain
MSFADKIRARLVDDYRVAMKWRSTQIATGGAVFAAIAFALSLSSAGMQFLGVFGLRASLALCAVIFVCALIGRIWRQQKLHELDEAGA